VRVPLKPVGARAAETGKFPGSTKNEKLSVQVWVWDGYWMPAELVTIFSDSERRRRVRFSNGVTAPVGLSNVIMRNPQVGEWTSPAPSQCDDVR
jgi:hypothetical protein